MKKLILFLTLFSITQIAAAELAHRHNLCRVWYSYDIFQTFLNLSVDLDGPTLIMDQHIPYGIRPMGHDITHISCDKTTSSLQISAKGNFNENILFEFTPVGKSLTQSGTVTYLDSEGKPVATKDWECSVEAAHRLCLELEP